MDKRSEDRMLNIFSMNFKGQCECSDIDNSDTVIMDMDDKDVASEWTEFRVKYPDVPVIILAKNNIELIGTIYISKPAKIVELLSALKKSSNKEISTNLNENKKTLKVANALESRHQTPTTNKETPASFGIFYNPEQFLQGKILRVIKEGNKLEKSMFLKCWKDHWIVTFPGSNSILQNVGDKKIKTLGLVQMGDGDTEQFSYSEHQFSDNEILLMADTPANKVKLTLTDQFIWNLTVKTARGRVPEGTSLDGLHVLQYWPNLPRLLHIPNAMRISAFWLDRPQSINNIILKLSIPLEDVLTYFSAASASGILKPAKRKEDEMIIPDIVIVDKKKQGIFAALISKVSKNIIRNKDLQDDGE